MSPEMTPDARTTMRAIGWPRPGTQDAPALQTISVPSVGPGQVMLRVAFSAINPADLRVASGDFVGRLLHARPSPLVVGYDFAGTVERCGAGVDDLRAGDEVFGHLPYAGSNRQGAFAERVVVDRGTVAKKPANVSLETAGASPTPGLTAIQSLRDLGRLPEGGRVLIIGAAGGVGTFSIGAAKRLGASVTAVCSTYAVDYVRGLGADEVIDRRKQDPLSVASTFDVVLDAAAVHSYRQCKHLLTSKGAYVRTLPDLGIGVGKLMTVLSSRRCEFITVRSRQKDLELLGSWIGQGMQVPIDTRFPVRDLQKGMEALKRGEAKGRLSIQVEGGFEGA